MKYLISLIYFVLLMLNSRVIAQSQNQDSAASLLLQGMEKVYNLDFAHADALFDSVIQMNPKHPQGYYFKSSSHFYQIISGYDSTASEEQFMELNDHAIAVAEEYERTDQVDGQFYRGTSYGNIARYHAMVGNFFKAFYYAKKSKSLHEDIIRRNPDIFDAYLTTGVYNYYAAAMPRWIDAVAGLFGLGGDRAQGIRQLETAFEKGKLAKLEAKFFLANVYYEEGNYEKSLRFHQELSLRFNRNPFLYNQLGLIYYSMEDFGKAELSFYKAREAVNASFMSSKMFADYFLGRINKLKNDYKTALPYLTEASEIGKNRKLFKSIDAWIVGAAYYQSGEVMELSGNRASAMGLYDLAKNHEYSGKSTAQASKNRLQYGLSEFEIEVIRARHLILFGKTEEGRGMMLKLKPEARNGNVKFLSQINFYLGRAEMAHSNYPSAKDYFLEALRTQTDDGDQKWREPQARYYLAFCYAHLGKNELAKNELNKVVDNDQYLEAPRFKFLSRELLKKL
ncbi:tetratricopeptide repeat protein [bacterium]|nr:MAG: tetratricopeptide repeat protein [bacterium]